MRSRIGCVLAVVAALAFACCGNDDKSDASADAGADSPASSTCSSPDVGRSEDGACASSGMYGVDERNPACCRPCNAGEVASQQAATTPHCVAVDSGAGDAAVACPSYDDADKACVNVDDCATVARGCYCGPQPVIGISKTILDVASACEMDAAAHCALGCANAPWQIADDGKETEDGGVIAVLCDLGECHTVVQ